MKRTHVNYAVATVLLAMLALAGCNKSEEPTPPSVTATPAATPPPATTPAPSTPGPMTPAQSTPGANVAITSVDLGNAVGGDMKVGMPMSSFNKTDTIIAAVSTSTSDPAANVIGKLGAKWTYQDGQVVNEESKDLNFTGSGATDFQISKPDGFPAGNYKVEITLDGNVVQSKDFTVK